MFNGFIFIRVRVRERLSATPGHVIGQGPAPGGQIVPCGGGGGDGGGDFRDDRLRCFELKQNAIFLLYRRLVQCTDAAEHEKSL